MTAAVGPDGPDTAGPDTAGPETSGLSIQETYYPTLTCFGCGHANPDGLKLRSYEVDGTVRATFRPWPQHDNGGGYLNGGIIATVLDCHGAAAVLLEAHRRGWEPAEGAGLAFVTAGLDIRYRRPTPLREPVELTAELLAVAEPEMTVVAHVLADGRVCATGQAVWKRWRPRPSTP